MAKVRGTLRGALWGQGEKPTSQSVMGGGREEAASGIPGHRTRLAESCITVKLNTRCLGGEGAEGL